MNKEEMAAQEFETFFDKNQFLSIRQTFVEAFLTGFNAAIAQATGEIKFLLEIAGWDNIDRLKTDKLLALYKKYEKMDNEGNLK